MMMDQCKGQTFRLEVKSSWVIFIISSQIWIFKVDKCVLTSSLSIIKPGKYRKLKDEVDDFDDVVQQGVSKVCWFSWLQTCTYHSTAFWRSLHSLHFFHIITYQHSYFFGTQVHTPYWFYVEVIRVLTLSLISLASVIRDVYMYMCIYFGKPCVHFICAFQMLI